MDDGIASLTRIFMIAFDEAIEYGESERVALMIAQNVASLVFSYVIAEGKKQEFAASLQKDADDAISEITKSIFANVKKKEDKGKGGEKKKADD